MWLETMSLSNPGYKFGIPKEFENTLPLYLLGFPSHGFIFWGQLGGLNLNKPNFTFYFNLF